MAAATISKDRMTFWAKLENSFDMRFRLTKTINAHDYQKLKKIIAFTHKNLLKGSNGFSLSSVAR